MFFYKNGNTRNNKIRRPNNYRLNEISKIKDYFNEEIQYQQSLTNKLSKYLTILDYSNKILTVFLTVFKLLYSAKNKLVCIELLISNSIKDGIINLVDFLEIIKKDYECLKNEDKIELV